MATKVEKAVPPAPAKTAAEALRTLAARGAHRLRQTGIDEELLDVASGFEALPKARGESARHEGGST